MLSDPLFDVVNSISIVLRCIDFFQRPSATLVVETIIGQTHIQSIVAWSILQSDLFTTLAVDGSPTLCPLAPQCSRGCSGRNLPYRRLGGETARSPNLEIVSCRACVRVRAGCLVRAGFKAVPFPSSPSRPLLFPLRDLVSSVGC